MTERPMLLDLFCGAGGAAMGYARAGFQVVGVDHDEQPNYPFEFIRQDALTFARHHARDFAAIHASPPCQWQTAYKRRPNHVAPSPNLIAETRHWITTRRGVYVIESPVSRAALAELQEPIMLCGSSFGLDVRRHRYFESNVPLVAPPCDHAWQTPRFAPATNRTNKRSTVEVGVWRIPLGVQQQAMGIAWMSLAELSEAIPPSYTECIGKQLLAAIEQRRAA